MCEIVLSNYVCLSIHYNYIMHTKCVIYLRVNHGEGYDDVLKMQGLKRIKAKQNLRILKTLFLTSWRNDLKNC